LAVDRVIATIKRRFFGPYSIIRLLILCTGWAKSIYLAWSSITTCCNSQYSSCDDLQ